MGENIRLPPPACLTLWQGPSVQGSGPFTRSVSAHPGTATASPLLSRRAPHPPLVRLKPYRNGCLLSLGSRSKMLLLFSCPFLPCKVAGSSLAKAFPVLPPGPRAILDRVSFTRALSPAFLNCRAWFCLGSCNTKGICAHFSQSGAVHCQPGQAPCAPLRAGCRPLASLAPLRDLSQGLWVERWVETCHFCQTLCPPASIWAPGPQSTSPACPNCLTCPALRRGLRPQRARCPLPVASSTTSTTSFPR